MAWGIPDRQAEAGPNCACRLNKAASPLSFDAPHAVRRYRPYHSRDHSQAGLLVPLFSAQNGAQVRATSLTVIFDLVGFSMGGIVIRY